MNASDIDGTLLPYGKPKLILNYALTRSWQRQGIHTIALVTNQGGLPFAIAQKREGSNVTFPTPAQFLERLTYLIIALDRERINVSAIRVCTYHPKAQDCDIQTAARELREWMSAKLPNIWHVYTTEAMRKPNGGMLRTFDLKTGTYYGDSDEDAAAAHQACWSFVKVERLLG
jgi:histidinol phosphatase-like enzyme